MPQVSASVWIPIPPELAFAVSQTQGEIRKRWDVFIAKQHLIDTAQAAKCVRTFTRTGLSMVSEYASYRPPTSVGMTMVRGPWFFEKFGGGWRFTAEARDEVAGTLATWKYTYSVRPTWLQPIAGRIIQRVLDREIKPRIAGFAKGCDDEIVLAAARANSGQ